MERRVRSGKCGLQAVIYFRVTSALFNNFVVVRARLAVGIFFAGAHFRLSLDDVDTDRLGNLAVENMFALATGPIGQLSRDSAKRDNISRDALACPTQLWLECSSLEPVERADPFFRFFFGIEASLVVDGDAVI